MSTRIKIRHVSGSKANQIEQFQIDDLDQVTIGRDPSSTITFDPTRDDRVSRSHATIRIVKGDKLAFRIVDNGSSNGTKVNGAPVQRERETDLLPDDRIEVGSGGPVIVFDVEPRPPHMVARTKIIGAEETMAPPAAATRIEPGPSMATGTGLGTSPPTGDYGTPPPTMKVGVGRETMMREVAQAVGVERQANTQKWMYTLAGVLAVVAVVGGGLYWRMSTDKQQAVQAAASAQQAVEEARLDASKKAAALENQAQKIGEQAKRASGLTPQEIVAQYRKATVFLEVQWRLYDRDSLKPLFHKSVAVNGVLQPCYVEYEPGKIVRWLTTEDEERTNFPVGSSGRGTGFVVSSDGYILTNKHVAAGWMIDYNEYSPYERGRGVVFKALTGIPRDKKGAAIPLAALLAEKQGAGVIDFFPTSQVRYPQWRPDSGGMIFHSGYPIRTNKDPSNAFFGKNEGINARFPGSSLSIAADLVRPSTVADVALVKINSPQKLDHVELAEDHSVAQGAPITVLGYPGTSTETFAVIRTQEAGVMGSRVEQIPEPTVTPGVVSLLGRAREEVGGVTVVATLGDVYQLTAGAAAGNSGGPVFDTNGKVVAIFTFGSPRRETTTWAVPIHYGRDLFEVQR